MSCMALGLFIKTEDLRGGLRGLYRGFGILILNYPPSNALWAAAKVDECRPLHGIPTEEAELKVQDT